MLATTEISGAAGAWSRVVEWLVATVRHGWCQVGGRRRQGKARDDRSSSIEEKNYRCDEAYSFVREFSVLIVTLCRPSVSDEMYGLLSPYRGKISWFHD
jgi:hypothetical protein